MRDIGKDLIEVSDSSLPSINIPLFHSSPMGSTNDRSDRSCKYFDYSRTFLGTYYCSIGIIKVYNEPQRYSTINTQSSLKCLLLLRILHQLLPTNHQTLPLPHTIHVPLRHILLISQLPQILQIVLRERHPERILVQDLIALEDELWRCSPRCALPYLVAETK